MFYVSDCYKKETVEIKMPLFAAKHQIVFEWHCLQICIAIDLHTLQEFG